MFLDSTLIVNHQLYELLSSVIKCVICEGILFNPLKCSKCDNSFCKTCIDKWKNHSTICPFQCVNPTYTSSKYLQRILSKLTFYCEKGCYEVIAYNDIDKHLNYICPNANLKEAYQNASIKSKQLQIENEILQKMNKAIVDKIDKLHMNFDTNKKDNVIVSKNHPHSMIFVKRSFDWVCNKCDQLYENNIKSAYCLKCDFDLCAKCYFNEFMNIN